MELCRGFNPGSWQSTFDLENNLVTGFFVDWVIGTPLFHSETDILHLDNVFISICLYLYAFRCMSKCSPKRSVLLLSIPFGGWCTFIELVIYVVQVQVTRCYKGILERLALEGSGSFWSHQRCSNKSHTVPFNFNGGWIEVEDYVVIMSWLVHIYTSCESMKLPKVISSPKLTWRLHPKTGWFKDDVLFNDAMFLVRSS